MRLALHQRQELTIGNHPRHFTLSAMVVVQCQSAMHPYFAIRAVQARRAG